MSASPAARTSCERRSPRASRHLTTSTKPPTGAVARVARVFFRLLREADIARLLPLDDIIELMADALRRFSAGQVAQPVRTVLPVGSHGQLFGMMPAYIPGLPTFGAKLVSVVPSNAGTRVPTHLATVLLFTPETGALVAVVDGQYITEYRTAAVSAVSADLLAREESGVLAIIGSGVQARSHLEAMDRVFELSETRVWSPTPEHQEQFVDDMKTVTASRLVGSPSAADAVRGADLVVIATSASEPVVQNDWVKTGAHVISVGACRPTERELDPALVRRGRLFVDSRAAALVESGDIVMGIQEDHLPPVAHHRGAGRGDRRQGGRPSLPTRRHDFQVARACRRGRHGRGPRVPARCRAGCRV